jgi:hypothetical protein
VDGRNDRTSFGGETHSTHGMLGFPSFIGFSASLEQNKRSLFSTSQII